LANGTLTADTLPDDVLNSMKTLEMKAGLPDGFSEMLSRTITQESEQKIVSNKFSSDGTKVTVLIQESDGTIRTETYDTGLPAKPTTTKYNDNERIVNTRTFVDSKRGTDGLISASDYMEAQQNWIGMGGSASKFQSAFPPESVMGAWELPNLPASARPAAKRIVDLLPNQQTFIKQVQESIDNVDIEYDEAVEQFPEIAQYLKP